jgi:hypothetical protein
VLAAGTAAAFGQKPNPQYYEPFTPLTKYKPPAARLKQNIPNPIPDGLTASAAGGASTKPATTAPVTTQPSATPAYFTGTPVYVTGGKAYKLSGDKKDLVDFDHESAKPYAWALAHDVRGAQQALGARGCTDCHSSNAPVFDGKVHSDTLLTGAVTTSTMNNLRREEGVAALSVFAMTYPMRPILIAIGYGCAIVLALVVVNHALRAVGVHRR